MITIQPASEADAAYVGSHLRAADEQEVLTSTGLPGTVVVPLSFQLSRESYAVFKDSSVTPCAVFGVADDPIDPTSGVVWLLATDDIKQCALSVIDWTKTYLDRMARHYSAGLYNYADQRNTFHLRWARLNGFVTHGTILRHGLPFTHISYRPPNV